MVAQAQAQAPAGSSKATTEVIAKGLQNPWAVAFIGDGRMLVTERPGRMRVVQANGELSKPLVGVPEVDAVGQGGLLDLITDRDFVNNRRVFFCYSEPGLGGNSTALASARLAADASRLEDVKVIFSQKPKVPSRSHFGCRIVQMPDHSLFLTLGDRFQRMKDAQTLDNHHGKVVRVQLDGTPHPANPFLKRSGALPE
ncbi:MAG TPA: PQQ-dependent sugar dehydrogenase, partial [Hydrogenophaga sp.]|nr:PQQ-dependent sugar dehydrogenase [Hydrogenophaga sp.]